MSRRIVVAVVLLAATASGCASHGAAKAGSPASASTGSSGSPSPSPSASPTLTPTAPASTALGAGQRVWAAFSERGLSHADWWAQLRPRLSSAARAVYVYDDPRNIPVMSLTGRLHVAAKPPAAPHFTSEVVVPTSKGVFRLDLERHTRHSAWLLYAVKFPRSVQ